MLTEMRISKNLPPRPAQRRVGLAHDRGPVMQRRDASQPPGVSNCGGGRGLCPPGGHVSNGASAMATVARPRPSLGHDQRRRPGAQAHMCVICRQEEDEAPGNGSRPLHLLSGRSQVLPSRPPSSLPTFPRPLATQVFLPLLFLLLQIRLRLLPLLARLAAVVRPSVRHRCAALGHHAPPAPAAKERGILGRTRRAVRQPVAARAHGPMRRIRTALALALVQHDGVVAGPARLAPPPVAHVGMAVPPLAAAARLARPRDGDGRRMVSRGTR